MLGDKLSNKNSHLTAVFWVETKTLFMWLVGLHIHRLCYSTSGARANLSVCSSASAFLPKQPVCCVRASMRGCLSASACVCNRVIRSLLCVVCYLLARRWWERCFPRCPASWHPGADTGTALWPRPQSLGNTQPSAQSETKEARRWDGGGRRRKVQIRKQIYGVEAVCICCVFTKRPWTIRKEMLFSSLHN